MALGAQRNNILASILRQALELASIGAGVGLAMDWVADRLLSNLLFGVQPFDAITLVSVSLLLVGVTLLASIVPGFRAASIDPMRALRAE